MHTLPTPDEAKNGKNLYNPEETKEILQTKFCVHSQEKLYRSALAYIQQLEAANAELLTKCERLTEKCHQLEREWDAAVDDMRKAQGNICAVCKNYYRPDPAVRKYSCRIIGDFAKDGALTCGLFEWRGVKEE